MKTCQLFILVYGSALVYTGHLHLRRTRLFLAPSSSTTAERYITSQRLDYFQDTDTLRRNVCCIPLKHHDTDVHAVGPTSLRLPSLLVGTLMLVCLVW